MYLYKYIISIFSLKLNAWIHFIVLSISMNYILKILVITDHRSTLTQLVYWYLAKLYYVGIIF